MVNRGILVKIALGAVFIVGLGWFLAPYFAGSQMTNPVLLDLGWAQIYWYGFLLVAGVIAGYWLAAKYLAPARDVSGEHLLNLVIWALVGGLIGARLVFVILKWPFYAGSLSEIFLLTQGGLSIHGAVLFGALGVWWYARLAKLNFGKIADVLAPAVMLGQIIGRFGNFVNQEAFGGPTELPWRMFVALPFRPEGLAEFAYFHPTFLYEAVLGAVILLVLLRLFFLRLPAGHTAAWYLILYSSVRFATEFFRIDSDRLGMLTVAQWASIAIVAIGVFILYRKKHA